LHNKTIKDTEFLFLSAMLRAREPKMLDGDKTERLLDAPGFDDAAKLLVECGYPDMSGMDAGQLNAAISKHRSDVFDEISRHLQAKRITDIFRVKYDYHNIKVLVKSMCSNTDGSRLLSDSGRIGPKVLTEAFITGVRGGLPPAMTRAISEAVGILSRTQNPQLADIETDKFCYGELLEIAAEIGDDFVSGYVRLLIDSANLKTAVRTLRMKKDSEFLKRAVIQGGDVTAERLSELSPSGEDLPEIYGKGLLAGAALLGLSAIGGTPAGAAVGQMTLFERECDNAATVHLSRAKRVSFGIAPVFAYMAALETEITSVRMILTGKLSGITPEVIRERLRESYV
jgi:V/A-type H+-transporting ATPase subunit C